MAAPQGNSNRKGKTATKPYNLSVPRLRCGTCLGRDICPIAGGPEDPCGFLRRLRSQRGQLDSIDGVREVRRQLLLETLTQLNIMSIATENTGVSTKEMIGFRKLLLDQFARLESDMFEQDMKTRQQGSSQDFVTSLIKELAGSSPALPDASIDVPFKLELPVLEASYEK